MASRRRPTEVETSVMRSTLAALKAAFGRQWLLLTVTALAVVVTIAGQSSKGFTKIWAWLDPTLSIATLAAAILVWLTEIRQLWENSLPVQVTVEFSAEGRLVLSCERAPLLDASPRAWAQQIGRQMNAGENLLLKPVPIADPARIERVDGTWVKHIVVRFDLREWPSNVPRGAGPIKWGPDNDYGQATTEADC